jgi:hypothetical protein
MTSNLEDDWADPASLNRIEDSDESLDGEESDD